MSVFCYQQIWPVTNAVFHTETRKRQLSTEGEGIASLAPTSTKAGSANMLCIQSFLYSTQTAFPTHNPNIDALTALFGHTIKDSEQKPQQLLTKILISKQIPANHRYLTLSIYEACILNITIAQLLILWGEWENLPTPDHSSLRMNILII